MGYDFPPELDRLFREQMTVGGYQSAEDLLRDALMALDERRNAVIHEDDAVFEGIRRGLSDKAAGHFQQLSDFDREFRSKHGIPADA